VATIALYNHSTRLFANGTFTAADTYRVKLLTAATFDATDVTLADTGGTEVANANGYTTNGVALTGVAFTTVTTNDAKLDANDASWTATGGSITASYGILYNDTNVDNAPIAFLDFGGSETANSGTDFRVVWNANGIVTWTYSGV
jgi:hypothetical protein